MGDVGRKRVISEFTWERSGNALLDLIDSLQ
jgi:glycosyltransferase involved in cell wall biosynthesis